jgi:hypothetical protein
MATERAIRRIAMQGGSGSARSLSVSYAHVKPKLELVTLGYFIFPLVEDTKIPPEGMYWRTMASTDPDEVTSWWTKFPHDNVGIDCGKSKLLVIDLDSEEAADRFDTVWDRHEDSAWDDGRYPVVETRRGWHVYFDQESRSRGSRHIGCPKLHALGEGTDVKGDGGMVLGPGSVIKGHEYALVAGDLAQVGRCPYWLESMLKPRVKRSVFEQRKLERQRSRPIQGWGAKMLLKRAVYQISHAPPGHRNDRLNTWAYQLRNVAADVDVFGELLAAAEAAGLPEHEARATIRSGLGRNPWV